MLKITNWRHLLGIVALQAVVFAVGHFARDYTTASLYCATILLGASLGGYQLGVLVAATGTTLFIIGTVHGQTPASFWLRHGIDVLFMLALGATVGRLGDECAKITQNSLRDALTGLFNRAYLRDQLRSETDRARRYGHPLSVMMVDLDHFKQFNDRHGHRRGDALLKQVGHVLQTRMRSSDVACRYGGEEFCLILPETPLDACQVVGDRLRVDITNGVLYAPGLGERVTASIGVAAIGEGIDSPDALVEAADQALYQAKRTGRDKVVLYGMGGESEGAQSEADAD